MLNPERNFNIQFGWKCPECGAVMAPWQNACVNHHGNSNPQITNVPNTTAIPSWNTTITCKSNTTPTITAKNYSNTLDQIKATLETNLTK